MNKLPACCCMVFFCCIGVAQQDAPFMQADPAVIRMQSRLVLEDVLVLDAHGDPVHNLPVSAFHVTDNGHPQSVRDFSEGSPPPEMQPVMEPLPPGTFSNRLPAGTPPTTEVLLLDTDDTPLLDQMFLRKQLETAVDRMPPDLPVTVFTISNGRTVPVLSNSTDRAALQRALKETMPVQNHAIESRFMGAVNDLMTVAAYLQQTPGRKNLLWFASHFPLVGVTPGEQEPGGLLVDYTAREHIVHQVQESLAEARVSVYPIDPRGVLEPVMFGPSVTGASSEQRNPRAVNANSQKREVGAPAGADDFDSRSEMRSIASATGGRAFFLNNLAEEIDQAFDMGKAAYSLTYTPTPYSMDQSWHAITIQVDGGYQVSYRRGYLATFTGEANDPVRNRLTVGGGVRRVASNLRKPIVFQVKIDPQDARHVTATFSIPMNEAAMLHHNGAWTNTLIVTSYAYDASGRVRDGKAQQLDTKLSDANYDQANRIGQAIVTRQQLQLSKGAKYFVFFVRDPGSERTGSLVLRTEVLNTLPHESTSDHAAANVAAPETGTGSDHK